MRELLKYKNKGVIYKITSPSGGVYFGKSINVYSRYKSYRTNNIKYQPLLKNSIRKYGWEAHCFEIVEVFENISNEDLLDRERYWIKKEKTNRRRYRRGNGLNCTDGGEGSSGCFRSDEFKEKCRQRMLGNNLSVGCSTPSPMKGKKLPSEWRENVIRAKNKREHIPKNSTKVLNLVTGIYYDSINKAAKSIGKSFDYLSKELKREDNLTDFVIVELETINCNKINKRRTPSGEDIKKRVLDSKLRVEVLKVNVKTNEEVLYASISQCSKENGIPLTTLRSLVKSGEERGGFKFVGRKINPEIKHNHSGRTLTKRHKEALRRNHTNNLKVDAYKPTGEFIGTYESCKQASQSLSLPHKSVTSSISGELTNARGYLFKKHGEELTSKDIMNYYMLGYKDNILFDPNSGIYYESHSDAARAFGLSPSTVDRQISGRYPNRLGLVAA